VKLGEESVVPLSFGYLQILRSAKNAELRMTESPSIFEGIHEYACYCSNLPLEPGELHPCYQARATSETWIEQVKSQLMAGTTLTDNFHANDILWQLSVLAYNCSVAMRSKKKKGWRQEHATFRDWFIKQPARLKACSQGLILHLPEKYFYKWHWLDFEKTLSLAT
jgi:hypothetical protein